MNNKFKHRIVANMLLVLVSLFLLAGSGSAQETENLTPEEAQDIAVDAYIYGYSLISTDVTRVQMSNVPKVEELSAPTGAFFNVKKYPPAGRGRVE